MNQEPPRRNPTAPDDDTLEGERGLPSVNRARSIRSRVGTAAVAIMLSVMTLAFLWIYYSNHFERSAKEKEAAAQKKPASDTRIPPFVKPQPVPVAYKQAELAPAPSLPPPPLPVWAGPTYPGQPATATAPAGTPPKTAAQLDLERRLSGPAVYRGAGTAAPVSVSVPRSETLTTLDSSAMQSDLSSDMAGLLRPTVTATARATRLPPLGWLMTKGEFLDCALITAIDSTLPGMTACVLSADAWSADGSRVLMVRGTKLVGETRGEVRQGQARVFVLWSEARTPDGMLIALASPGTDALGRSGVEGEVDRHWGERFGAAVMLSLIDGAITAAASSGNGNVNVGIGGGTGVKDVMTEVLKSTVAIPPTIHINQGARVQVFVSRDIMFSPNYASRP